MRIFLVYIINYLSSKIEYIKKFLAFQSTYLPKNHPDNSSVLFKIAQLKNQLGDIDECYERLEAILSEKLIINKSFKYLFPIFKYNTYCLSDNDLKLYGNRRHPTIAATLQEMAYMKGKNGDYQTALDELNEVLGG